MQDLFIKALVAYVEVLEIHIDTKTGDEPFHRKTWDFYEWLFDIAHTIGERFVDLWWQVREDTGNFEAQASRVLSILEELKKEIEASCDGTSKGTENLLYAHLDSLEWMIGSAKWFTKNKSSITKEEKEIVVEVEPKEKETSKEDSSSEDLVNAVEEITAM